MHSVRRLVLAGMPTLALAGIALTLLGSVKGYPVVTGAGLVLTGMWSAVAVAELFMLINRQKDAADLDDEE